MDDQQPPEWAKTAMTVAGKSSGVGCVMPLSILAIALIGRAVNLPGIIIVALAVGVVLFSLAAIVRAAIRDSQEEMRRYQARRQSPYDRQEDDH